MGKREDRIRNYYRNDPKTTGKGEEKRRKDYSERTLNILRNMEEENAAEQEERQGLSATYELCDVPHHDSETMISLVHKEYIEMKEYFGWTYHKMEVEKEIKEYTVTTSSGSTYFELEQTGDGTFIGKERHSKKTTEEVCKRYYNYHPLLIRRKDLPNLDRIKEYEEQAETKHEAYAQLVDKYGEAKSWGRIFWERQGEVWEFVLCHLLVLPLFIIAFPVYLVITSILCTFRFLFRKTNRINRKYHSAIEKIIKEARKEGVITKEMRKHTNMKKEFKKAEKARYYYLFPKRRRQKEEDITL